MISLSFANRKPTKLADEPLLNYDEPQIIFFTGMRGSGKGVAVDANAEELYKQGINIWHLWGARSFENLYWAINKNCGVKHKISKQVIEKFFEIRKKHILISSLDVGITGVELKKHLQSMELDGLIKILDNDEIRILEKSDDFRSGNLLYCKCKNAYPITWIIPDYIEIDEESLAKFNTVYFKDWKEYNSAYEKKTVKEFISPWHWDDSVKIPKPESMLKPLIIVRKITPATTPHRKEIFREQFTDIVLEARDQRRIVVMNPTIFEGTLDKFQTIEEVFRFVPYLMNVSGHFTKLDQDKVGKPEKDWNPKQRGWHKVAIIINELRSVAPSSRLSGETNAGKSKKAIFDVVPEMRHMKTWFLGDYQNPEDLYAGVKHQSNAIVLKNASRNLVGEDMAWIFDSVEKKRLAITRKYYPEAELKSLYYYERNPEFKAYLDDICPRVDELPKNQGYITYPNREFKKEKFDMPSFHHKGSLEDFRFDTGITWTVNKDLKPKDEIASKEGKQNTSKEMKEAKDKIMKIIEEKRNNSMSWKQIHVDLVSLQGKGEIIDVGIADKSPKNLNDMYNHWKSKQAISITV